MGVGSTVELGRGRIKVTRQFHGEFSGLHRQLLNFLHSTVAADRANIEKRVQRNHAPENHLLSA